MTERMSRRRFLKVGATAAATVVAGGVAGYAATWAPTPELENERMGTGMSRVMVVYGTKSGCTSGVAERIGARLAGAGATVDVVPVGKAGDVSEYDAVLVGSGIRMSQWHEPVRRWVAANAGQLKGVPHAFFTVNLTLATEPERAQEIRSWTDPMIAETGVDPVDVGVFAGWNEPARFSFLERTIMKAMKAPVGDFRDWGAIDAWTDAAATRLAV